MEKIAQIQVNNIRKNFLNPPLSASAPNIGERIDTIIAVIAIPQVHNNVPVFSSEAITEVKKAP